MDFEQLITQMAGDLRALRAEEADTKNAEPRRGSRFVGQGADPAFVEHIANGGELRLAERQTSLARKVPQGGGLAGTFVKALSEGTGSSGGYLVAPEVSAEVVHLIRARSAVARLGPRVVPVSKELSVTSLSSGATAYYTAENAPIPVSEQTFAQAVLLRPRELAALVPVSNRLLRDAADNPAIEDVLRADLAEIIALREDLAFLQGTGTGGEPLGIRTTPGLTAAPSLGANGGVPTFDDLKNTVAGLRAVNAPFNRPGWIFNPRTLSTIERIKTSDGNYLGEAADLLSFDRTGGGGTLLGFPFVTTTQVPTNLTTGTNTDTSYVVFSSDWQEAWVGEEQGLTIEASDAATYDSGGGVWVSAWQNRQHVFRATLAHDFALRRPAFFTVLSGVRP